MRAQIPQSKMILIKADLPAATGLSVRHVDDLIAKGEFPPPARLSRRRIGWFSDEVAAWRERKRQERDAALAAGLTIGTQFQGRAIAAQPAK